MKYIYLLIDPINNIVRYVGATTNPKTRFTQHIKDASKEKKTGKTDKQKWILKLIGKKLKPKMKIVGKYENLGEARKQEEKEVIKHIKTIYNIHMPGRGSLGVKHYKKTGRLK